MKTLYVGIALLLACSVVLPAQNRYFTKTGHIDFYSHTAVEDIKADNDQVTSLLDVSTGELVFSALSRSFQFPKPLMQEHFNENYIESEKFPKSSFEGKITGFQPGSLSKPGNYPVKVAGKLTIHGVTKDISADGSLTVTDGRITGESVFSLNPEDYGIRIPAVVRQNIAESFRITVKMDYQPYQPKK